MCVCVIVWEGKRGGGGGVILLLEPGMTGQLPPRLVGLASGFSFYQVHGYLPQPAKTHGGQDRNPH